MDFGKISLETLKAADLSLPADRGWNKNVLSGEKVDEPKIYVGCAKWGRTEWVDKIYPEGTKEAKFLDHYVEHYNSIELNATHYKTYPPSSIQKWADKADGKDFIFCPKVPQTISHYSSFVDIEDKTNAFLEGIYAFGKHLGPIFLQVSDRFTPKRKDALLKYLESLPKDLQFFLEVRNPDWFSSKAETESLLSILKQLNVGYIITDTAGRRDCVHMYLSVPKAFVRFVGNSLDPTDYARIDDWVERIKYWLDNGLKELYFFMHMHDETYSPELSSYLVQKLNTHCGLSLKEPLFISELATDRIKKEPVVGSKTGKEKKDGQEELF
ncbi:DUF72 domain-containing protein [Segetibacter aerophilus]|uniref:DUF72 domain-containing protein n=1 Tax=Segetibacter aerophilus TaxID=670293 RepID=A0A512B7P6_9BACT|nr:DUF72 domain-containing protein [Segetibacter aerophilus]GEO07986.1 hypothetical protein SAE01_04820 [Segetibacter aerophilus]